MKSQHTANTTVEVRTSVVIISHNEGDNLARTVCSLLAGLHDEDDLIVVDDQSTDGSLESLTQWGERVTLLQSERRLGVAPARNLGAKYAHGDILIFSDAHIHAPRGWLPPLIHALADPDVGAIAPAISDMRHTDVKGYGMRWCDPAFHIEWLGREGESSTPYSVPLLCGCFTAMRRDVFDTIGGFDDGLIGWGMEDAEISLRLWSLGYRCVLAPDVNVAHLFRSAFPYQVDWEALLYNQLRVAVTHFGVERMRRVTERMVGSTAFPAAFARLSASDVWTRRDRFNAARRYNDDWFFDRFGLRF